MTDSTLLQRWTDRRDAEAFREITSRYAAMVYATCVRILGNATEAEDVAQECFETLAQTGKGPRDHLGAWLHAVATNRSLNRIRAEKRRRDREARFADQRNTHTEIEWNDVYTYVDEAITQLPDKLRVPVVAHFLENKSHAAIARAIGVPPRTVTYRIGKGIELVRKSLKKRGIPVATSALTAMIAANLAEAAPVPVSLTAALGKLAIAGRAGSAATGTLAAQRVSTRPGTLKWLLAMRSEAVLLAVVVTALLGVGVYHGVKTVRNSGQSGTIRENVADTITDDAGPPDLQRTDLTVAASTLPSGEARVSSDDVSEKAHVVTAGELEAQLPTPEEPEHDDQYASVSGYVVDDHGYPVPDARVTVALRSYTPVDAYAASTDASGFYTVRGITFTGTAVASANAPGFKQEIKYVKLEKGEHIDNVDFILAKGVTLNGRVLSTTGGPVPYATVEVWGIDSGSRSGSGGPVNVVATDPNGYFTLGFDSEGIAALRVSSNAYGVAFFNNVPVGLEEVVELRMEEPASLSGTISWEDGSAASDVSIGLRGRFVMAETLWSSYGGPVTGIAVHLSTTTDRQGRYRVPALPPGLSYLAQIESKHGVDLASEHALGIFNAGESHTWDYVLRRGMRVTGHVRGEQTARPLADIRIIHALDGVFYEDNRVRRDGSYELDLFQSGEYVIFPHYYAWPKNEMMAQYGKHVDWRSGQEITLDFELPDQFTLSVKVVDTNGNPVANAEVSRYTLLPSGTSSGYGWGHTDKSGTYSWGGFAPWTECWFRVQKEGHVPNETTHVIGEPGTVHPVEEVVLFASGGIEGRLVDPDGDPIGNAELRIGAKPEDGVIRYHGNDSVSARAETDSNGVFAIAQGFPATTDTVTIHALGYGGTDASVECIAGHIVDLGDIVLSPNR